MIYHTIIIQENKMRKILILPILMGMLISTKPDHGEERIAKEIMRMIDDTRTGYAYRKMSVITNYSYKYGVDPMTMARLAYTESTYRRKLVNKYSGCVGIFQISPKHWSHLIYRVQNGKYAVRAKNEPHEKFLKYIGVNTEIACIIMATYLKIYDGDYSKALSKYGGWNLKRYRNSPKRQKYLDKIINQ
jgi:hypothetical protein